MDPVVITHADILTTEKNVSQNVCVMKKTTIIS